MKLLYQLTKAVLWDVIELDRELQKEELLEYILKKSKANRLLKNKKIIKTIYVKDRIINYIIMEK